MKTMARATTSQSASIDPIHGTPWSHGLVAADPPELPTNDDWRASMVEAREALGLSQERLGVLVGASQNMISLIESGAVRSSKYVLAICKKLRIRPPVFHESEDQQTWAELGVLLEAKSPRQFRQAMALVEAMVQDQTEERDEASTNSDRRPSRK